ncbi:N-acetylglucosamine-6-phosphate deacetylase [Terrarubrum flagellatum]|uniref:N-acetylglucosamine-6-phosphate deacetylase n=1 Tax=Terrirubrum flagellatum TaxID=2895980 RepID=UPI0031456FC8
MNQLNLADARRVAIAESAVPHAITIEAARLFDGERLRRNWKIDIADGRIIAAGPASSRATGPIVHLAEDVMLAPGFIDTQVNGGGGRLLNDAPSLESIAAIAQAHRRFGVTGLLPTLITDRQETLAQLANVALTAARPPGVLGLHMEGPFISTAKKGVHSPEYIRPIDTASLQTLMALGKYGRSLVTIAPELVAAADIRKLVSAGVRVSAGHSDATHAQMLMAIDAGLTGVTHLFNAMSQMSARELGLVGTTFVDGRLIAGVICDGIHVHPLNLRTAFRLCGADRLMLVTDAMSTVGSDIRQFSLQGRPVARDGDRLVAADGTLAGAHLDMMAAVRNAVQMMGVSLEDALIMASRTPARFLGLGDELGRIKPGYRADLVAFSGDWSVVKTWIGGEEASHDGGEQMRARARG